MATISLRQANSVFSTGNIIVNAPLTNSQVDNNFANLNIAVINVEANVSTPTSLTTQIKSNIVAAINELRGNLTSSAGLATLLGDETGSGFVVYSGSPTLSGTPQSSLAANGTSNAMVATTQFVNNQIQNSPNIQTPIINNIQLGYTTTATTGGTTTLTNQSTYQQVFTGTLNHTIVLPVASTLAVGTSYHIENNSSGTLTIQSSGNNTIVTVLPFQTVVVTCILASGTDAASWDWDYHAFGGISGSSGNVVIQGSPTFTGTPQAVTTANGTSNAMIATTQFVNNEIRSSPTLDTPILNAPTINLGTSNFLNLINPTLVSTFEIANIRNEAPPATVNLDLLDSRGSIVFFTSNTSANIAVNLRANATTSLDSWLGSTTSNANVATGVLVVINGATQYYVNNVQIDGRIMHNSTIGGNLFWLGNTLSSGGTAQSIDAYSFTVVKNGGNRGGASYGGNVYTILASQSNYKAFKV